MNCNSTPAMRRYAVDSAVGTIVGPGSRARTTHCGSALARDWIYREDLIARERAPTLGRSMHRPQRSPSTSSCAGGLPSTKCDSTPDMRLYAVDRAVGPGSRALRQPNVGARLRAIGFTGKAASRASALPHRADRCVARSEVHRQLVHRRASIDELQQHAGHAAVCGRQNCGDHCGTARARTAHCGDRARAPGQPIVGARLRAIGFSGKASSRASALPHRADRCAARSEVCRPVHARAGLNR